MLHAPPIRCGETPWPAWPGPVFAWMKALDGVKESIMRWFASGAANLVLALVSLAALLALTLGDPIVDLHAFRQTQTAITVFWMGHGGDLFAYQTPVLGAPWTIPFELPTYQWLVLATWATGIPLEPAGRLVSVVAMLAALWPLRSICRELSLDPRMTTLVSAVVLTAPVTLFWSRTVMPESMALLLALAWLSLLFRLRRDPAWWRLAALLVVGALASGTKITTFAPYLGLGMLVVADAAWTARRSFGWWAAMAAALFVPVVAGIAWTEFTDTLKVASPLATELTSDRLTSWNFGTLAQRMSGEFFVKALWERPTSVLGVAVLALPLLLAAALVKVPRAGLLALLLVCVYLGGFAVFANLYLRHDYYHFAVAPALAMACVVTLGALLGMRRPGWLVGAVFLVQVSQLWAFEEHYGELLRNNGPHNSFVKLGEFIRSHSREGDGMLIVGTSYNSAIPYYAQRRTVGIPEWASFEQVDALIRTPAAGFGGVPLTIAVKCDYQIASLPSRQRALIERYFDELAPIDGGRIGSCQVYEAPPEGVALAAEPPAPACESPGQPRVVPDGICLPTVVSWASDRRYDDHLGRPRRRVEMRSDGVDSNTLVADITSRFAAAGYRIHPRQEQNGAVVVQMTRQDRGTVYLSVHPTAGQKLGLFLDFLEKPQVQP
jgi:hypothetical protein